MLFNMGKQTLVAIIAFTSAHLSLIFAAITYYSIHFIDTCGDDTAGGTTANNTGSTINKTLSENSTVWGLEEDETATTRVLWYRCSCTVCRDIIIPGQGHSHNYILYYYITISELFTY